MTDQTKQGQIKDLICDRIINAIEENNYTATNQWATAYETLFGSYDLTWADEKDAGEKKSNLDISGLN